MATAATPPEIPAAHPHADQCDQAAGRKSAPDNDGSDPAYIGPNASLKGNQRDSACQLSEDDQHWLLSSIERLGLSARAYHRLLTVARTIADLQESADIQRPHLMEALGLRALDRYQTA